MTNKRILITTSTFGAQDPSPLNALKERGFQPVLNPFKRKLSPEEAATLLSENRPLGLLAGTEKIDRQLLLSAKDFLKVISRVGVGVDNVDLETAKELGISVHITPDAPTSAVAELTIGLMLSVLRKIARADREIRAGKWTPHMGGLLEVRTVGLIGLGRIGLKVAGILTNGFGVKVVGYDPYLSPENKKNRITIYDSLDELLKISDIVSLHIPGTGNKPVLGAKELELAKNGAIIINTSRGGLIDETALKLLLDSGKLGGAGLDVFGQEPYSGALLGCDSVVTTMHMGSYANESRIRMENEAVANLIKAVDMGNGLNG
jgi:D-3-phosphoglycerate dehydrogenase